MNKNKKKTIKKLIKVLIDLEYAKGAIASYHTDDVVSTAANRWIDSAIETIEDLIDGDMLKEMTKKSYSELNTRLR